MTLLCLLFLYTLLYTCMLFIYFLDSLDHPLTEWAQEKVWKRVGKSATWTVRGIGYNIWEVHDGGRNANVNMSLLGFYWVPRTKLTRRTLWILIQTGRDTRQT